MNDMDPRKSDVPVGFQACPFRTLGQPAGAHPSGMTKSVLCEAGGGFELGTTDCLDAVNGICASCDIPPSLNLPHACLYLVPFRVFRQGRVQSFFGCRWYFSINPDNTPKNIDWCRGCRDWFPRPPEDLIPGQISISRTFHRYYLNPSERRSRLLLPPVPRKMRWSERLRDLFYW